MSSEIVQDPLVVCEARHWRGTTSQFLDHMTLDQVRTVLDDIRHRGRAAVEDYARRWDRWDGLRALQINRDELCRKLAGVDRDIRDLLERVHDRIKRFAEGQLNTVRPLDMPVSGGRAGHRLLPVEHVGCYVPGGRYPLPSTALMTVTTARVAGCRRVVVATPQPDPVILAAAAIAGADEVLLVGGAQAIGALAWGIEGLDPVDLIVGPGNRWVTAAKQLVAGRVGIDMLAGPSELVVVADEFADAHRIALDLLAQAEHDVDARPYLVTTSHKMAAAVNREILLAIANSPQRSTLIAACRNGAAIIAADDDQLISVLDRLAPEHLELHTRNADELARRCQHAGCVFIGANSAEVFGDYGVGPNHTLPTGGTARFSSGLNVMTFLRWQTWLQLESPLPAELLADTRALAQLEGLGHHQLAAAHRGT